MTATNSGSKSNLFDLVSKSYDRKSFKDLSWEGSLGEYFNMVRENPDVARTSFQRVYDMILSYGTEEYSEYKKTIVHYNFFDDPRNEGKDGVFGLDVPLMKLVAFFKSAAQRLGTEKRLLLLHGPVGSSKSTIVRMLKKGLEDYSKTSEGSLFTFSFVKNGNQDLNDLFRSEEDIPSPMHEDPLYLVPEDARPTFLKELNRDLSPDRQINIEGHLSPACRYMYSFLMRHYGGDWEKAMTHIRVKRLILSERDRVGIGTFQPKDEKNQDSTELTGDINYRKIAEYGSDSDPRAFNFDGELNIANRGVVEFIEILKLDVAFLYDLLGASQEHKIKPKKFAQTHIDEVIIGHTNEPEYRKLMNNEFMEALRDRTIKVDVPYITKLDEEIKIYRKDFTPELLHRKKVAPHSIEMAALWAVLTRLEEPKKANLTLLQKLKLYNGKTLPGYTEDNIKELRKEAQSEGMGGISPRYIQDKISNSMVSDRKEGCINPFMILNELEGGLKNHALLRNEDQRKRYKELLEVVKKEYEDIVKNEVQRAISADEDAIAKLCANYVDNVKAYTQKEKVKNKYTGQDEEPDERLMRSIEDKIDIPESRKDDFRREIMNYIGALAVDGKTFDFRTNERLHKALELKLFEDQKDSIKLTSLVSSVVDKETQEKIDIVKSRLKKYYGYCDECATDVLNYVASVFARGDIKEKNN